MQVENGLLSSFSVIRFLFSSHTHYCIKSKTFCFYWECCVAFQTDTKLSFVLWLIRRLCSCCRLLKRICWFPLCGCLSLFNGVCVCSLLFALSLLFCMHRMWYKNIRKYIVLFCRYLSFHFRAFDLESFIFWLVKFINCCVVLSVFACFCFIWLRLSSAFIKTDFGCRFNVTKQGLA